MLYAKHQLHVQDVRPTVTFLAGVGVVVIGFALILLWFAIGLLTKPFTTVLRFTRGIEGHDLVSRLPAGRSDEIGQTAVALNAIVASFHEAIVEVAGGAGRLATVSRDLEQVSDRMGSAAEATSDRATSASGAAEQISRSVTTAATGLEQLADSVQEVARTAASAAISADAGVRSADRTSGIVEQLSASSLEISGIVAVINDIAEQTHLLALNATIEAARAGDAGRGFAIVANEVKDLARETAAATERIGAQVAAIQRDSSIAAEAISEIATVIHEMSDFQTTIAAAVEQQAVTTAEIGRSVANTADGGRDIADSVLTVATSADLARESATDTKSTAAALLTLSEDLQSLVDRFRITV